MAVMSDAERAACHADWMRDPVEGQEIVITKADLRAAINAVDQWISDNQMSFNDALPVAARTNLTKQQKAQLLLFVVAHRFDLDI